MHFSRRNFLGKMMVLTAGSTWIACKKNSSETVYDKGEGILAALFNTKYI